MTHLSLIFTSRSWSAPGHLLNQPGVPAPAPSTLLKSTQYDCYSDSKWLWVCIFVTGPYLHPLWAWDTHLHDFPLTCLLTNTHTHTHCRGTWASFNSSLSSYCIFHIQGIFRLNVRQQNCCPIVFPFFYCLKLISRACVHLCVMAGPIWKTFVSNPSPVTINEASSLRVIDFDGFGPPPEILCVHSVCWHAQFYGAMLKIQIWLH